MVKAAKTTSKTLLKSAMFNDGQYFSSFASRLSSYFNFFMLICFTLYFVLKNYFFVMVAMMSLPGFEKLVSSFLVFSHHDLMSASNAASSQTTSKTSPAAPFLIAIDNLSIGVGQDIPL